MKGNRYIGSVILLLVSAYAHADNYYGKPQLNPPVPDITFKLESTNTLRCEGTKPIKWVLPNDSIQYTIQDYTDTTDSILKYGKELIVTNVTVNYVGSYICVYNDSSLSIADLLRNTSSAARYYVFVDDPFNLIQPVLEDEHFLISQRNPVIIPCKPTSKDTKLELFKDNERKLQPDEYRFDPTIGFILTLHVEDSGDYMCKAAQNAEGSIEFTVLVQGSTLDPSNTSIKKLEIKERGNDGHAIQGKKFTLECTVQVEGDKVAYHMYWTKNKEVVTESDRIVINGPHRGHNDGKSETGNISLTFENIDAEKDEGEYTCEVKDDVNHEQRSILLNVLEPDTTYITLSEPTNRTSIEVSTNKSKAQWHIKFKGYPRPTPIWFDNQGNVIHNSSDGKYGVDIFEDYTILTINSLQLKDSGLYVLKAANEQLEKNLTFKLIVKDKPSIRLKSNSIIVREGEEVSILCDCAGYPASTISWEFSSCEIKPAGLLCSNDEATAFNDTEFKTTVTSSQFQQSILHIKPTHPINVKCKAENSEGHDEDITYIYITDLEKSFDVWNKDDITIVGNEVTLHCAVSVYNFTNDLSWYFNDKPVNDIAGIEIRRYVTKYSYHTDIIWNSVELLDSGIYECRSKHIYTDIDEILTIMLNVIEPFSPSLVSTAWNITEMHKMIGDSIRLECVFEGIPVPSIMWFKDGIELTQDSIDSRIKRYTNDSLIYIQFLMSEDQGEYKCEAENTMGRISQQTNLIISNMPKKLGTAWIWGITVLVVLISVFAVIIGILIRRVSQEHKLLKIMKASGLANFEEGIPGSLNPAMALDEQADLLPYDRKFEFPRENLKLGKQLGAGAFGIVVKATAYGIQSYENETVVAVKMVKKTADNEIMRALVTELKIMVHLGQHLNVVNLLGAVTKNIAKREVMVIVEYCRFGNVQNFLFKHREYFINQINFETDELDTSITGDQRWSKDSGYDYIRKGKHMESKQRHGLGNEMNSKGYFTHQSNDVDELAIEMNSGTTETALISTYPGGNESVAFANHLPQSAWSSNFKMEYEVPARCVSTSDLVCWAFQVARGMDYLSSRKVLHGDLAARNILLCEDNVVKICDFGLARSMYKNENYKKKGQTLLPFKWLALEAIGDNVFSTYSDIWSFGIVLWELFSLAKVPYPGMEADQSLFLKLQNGYRMEKPEFSNEAIYDIMLHCWNANPEKRPSFSQLENSLGHLLHDGVKDHYIDLNSHYLQMNTSNITGNPDYLAMMGPPMENAPPIPPNYVNQNSVYGESADSLNYVHMNPKLDTVEFGNCSSPVNISLYPRTSHTKTNKKIPEIIPMLSNEDVILNSDSENETSHTTYSNTADLKSFQNSVKADNISGNKKNNLKDTVINPGYISVNAETNGM